MESFIVSRLFLCSLQHLALLNTVGNEGSWHL